MHITGLYIRAKTQREGGAHEYTCSRVMQLMKRNNEILSSCIFFSMKYVAERSGIGILRSLEKKQGGGKNYLKE